MTPVFFATPFASINIGAWRAAFGWPDVSECMKKISHEAQNRMVCGNPLQPKVGCVAQEIIRVSIPQMKRFAMALTLKRV